MTGAASARSTLTQNNGTPNSWTQNNGTQGNGSATRAAISAAAAQLGVPDPIAIADELLGTDADALQEWFAVAHRAQVRLVQGALALADAMPVLAAGWSSPAPRVAVGAQREAGLASRGVVVAQVDAADETGATLRQSRALADAEVSRAAAAVAALGWPPGQDLLGWAVGNGQSMAVAGLVSELYEQLDELRGRNTAALQSLALALRADPRDPVENVESSAAVGNAVGTGVAGAGGLALGIAGSLSGQLGTTAGPGVAGIDAHNRDLLAADLQSTDAATLAMALGVRAALQRAAADGGVGQLLVYESPHDGGQGRAAISVGDITTADNVATLAPGVGNAPVNMAEGISDAAALRRQAELQAPGDATAVVSWYGYDIPLSAMRGVPVDPISALGNTVAALDDSNARAGGSQLVTDLAQFRQLAPDTARFVAVGFSMGSTAVSAAAARGAKLDDLVLLGSPGASTDVETADDYPDVPADHTFVVSYDQDPVTRGQTDLLAGVLGAAIHGPTQQTPFGPDPAAKGFGAQVVDADSNNPDIEVEFHTGGLGGPLADLLVSDLVDQAADVAAHHQESNYLSGESLDAVAAVVVGQYSDVPVKPGR